MSDIEAKPTDYPPMARAVQQRILALAKETGRHG